MAVTGGAIPAPAAQEAACAHPPNWYPDPHAPGRERWWDGTRWTWDTRDPAAAASSASA
jgi:hypothetical protein